MSIPGVAAPASRSSIPDVETFGSERAILRAFPLAEVCSRVGRDDYRFALDALDALTHALHTASVVMLNSCPPGWHAASRRRESGGDHQGLARGVAGAQGPAKRSAG